MSYHKATVKVSSNTTILFSRKSTLNRLPRKQAMLYTRRAYYSATDMHVCCQTAKSNLRFCTTQYYCPQIMSVTQFRKHFMVKKCTKEVPSTNHRDFICMQCTQMVNTLLCPETEVESSSVNDNTALEYSGRKQYS